MWIPFNCSANRKIYPWSSFSHWYLSSIGGSKTSDTFYALRFWQVKRSLDPTWQTQTVGREIDTEICGPADSEEKVGTDTDARARL